MPNQALIRSVDRGILAEATQEETDTESLGAALVEAGINMPPARIRAEERVAKGLAGATVAHVHARTLKLDTFLEEQSQILMGIMRGDKTPDDRKINAADALTRAVQAQAGIMGIQLKVAEITAAGKRGGRHRGNAPRLGDSLAPQTNIETMQVQIVNGTLSSAAQPEGSKVIHEQKL